MTPTIDLASYKEALVLLGTAGVVVPIVHRFRISPILGFLAAGALLGPHMLGGLSQRIPARSCARRSHSATCSRACSGPRG